MDAKLQQDKAALREEIRARLEKRSDYHRSSVSKKCCALLREQRVWARAKSVLFFASLPEEPNLWPLLHEALAAGKVVALPRFISHTQGYGAAEVRDVHRDLALRKLKILEPSAACSEVSLNRLDLVLVPGVAFDLHGHRLGRGKGYYDRLLANVRGVKCGAGFDEQIVDAVSVGPLDIHLDCLLTPTRWVEIAKQASDKPICLP
ncbi:MAG: 5-formyltetrahydrofolate cyclo-ligase [Verrucomicrobia bacterium]|jgi:5-formyltetrahydrofolate cyclo-ligase|nr:5-formyltetrahydrofolate cyclo-ligase [Verrucomicrobiota bacterium]